MVVILRANQIYSQPGRPGRLPMEKTYFYEEIEPRLEKVVLGPKAVGRHPPLGSSGLIKEGVYEASPRSATSRPQQARVQADAGIGRDRADCRPRQ